jgi:RNA ligase (TIGR02306 family)
MSEFHVKLIQIENMRKHENADSLSIVQVWGYPVVVRTTDFKVGDWAFYIPVDSVVPEEEPFLFLGEHRHIKAKKLRGVFSMGMLTPLSALYPNCVVLNGWLTTRGGRVLGNTTMDWQNELMITRFEPPEPTDDRCEVGPIEVHGYTEIPAMRAYPDAIPEGMPVSITEKIDGETFRAVYIDDRMWLGSANTWKKPGDNRWWSISRRLGLEEKLKARPGMVVYGEIYGRDPNYGKIQIFDYGTEQNGLRIFDIFDLHLGKYLNVIDISEFAEYLNIPMVPLLYIGNWDKELISLAEGKSTIGGGKVREGIVVRPLVETFHPELTRLILKYHGEGYLLQK